MANQTFKCKNCGGELVWNPAAQKLKCPYCASEYNLSEFQEQEEQVKEELDQDTYEKGEDAGKTGQTGATDDTGINSADLRVYKCSTCGAEVVTDKTTMASVCAFCGSPITITEQMDTTFRPKWIIPFKVSPDQVRDKYTKLVKGMPFAPREFTARNQIEKIKGVYIPFWLYSFREDGALRATAERLTVHDTPKYTVTTHHVFEVDREAEADFKSLPVDASSRTPDDIMDSIEPFDFKEMKPFKMPYMAGFMAERYDQDADFCFKRAGKRAETTMAEKLRASVIGYNSVTVTGMQAVTEGAYKSEYALIPVYLLFTKYRGKDYLYAVNGQTGKAVGDVPADKGRAAFFALLTFAVSFGGALLIDILLKIL